jgi:hypothetical protein
MKTTMTYGRQSKLYVGGLVGPYGKLVKRVRILLACGGSLAERSKRKTLFMTYAIGKII